MISLKCRPGLIVGWLTMGCIAAGAVAAAPAAADTGLRQITVDAARPVGIIRSLQGVSGTPLPGDSSHPDFTSQFQQLGVDIVRTHDVDCQGTSDIDGTGPNRTSIDGAGPNRTSPTGTRTRTTPPATTSARPTVPCSASCAAARRSNTASDTVT